MATVYFTNNSDSGDGSFRDALSSSSTGDTIEPDPNVAWGDELIVIPLSSPITWGNRNRTITGGANHRIRFDGQGLVNHITMTSSNTVVFKKVEFVGGYRGSYGSAIYAQNSSPSLSFENCRFSGNKSDSESGVGSISSNSSSYTLKIALTNCVISGEGNSFITSGRVESGVFNNCTFSGNKGTRATANCEYNNCLLQYATYYDGFVSPPPAGAEIEWTKDVWKDWDLRLKPGASALEGADGEETTDFLGHARKPNGAVGAYEGSWVVARDGTTAVNESTRADYAEIGESADVVLGANAALVVGLEATIGTCAFSCEENASAYVAFPIGTNVENAVFGTGVNYAETNGVESAAASVAERVVSVSLAGTAPPRWVEFQPVGADSWTRVDLSNANTFEAPSDAAFKIRAFDGEFAVSAPVPRTYYYNGAQDGGSFAVAGDWTMDAARTLTCNAQPTIAGGTFDCRR